MDSHAVVRHREDDFVPVAVLPFSHFGSEMIPIWVFFQQKTLRFLLHPTSGLVIEMINRTATAGLVRRQGRRLRGHDQGSLRLFRTLL